jgi:hypothetical protein
MDSVLMVDQSLLDMLPQKARYTLSGSSKDWETSQETFALDLNVIMKYISQQRTSKENLLAASSLSLWLLSNFIRAQLENEDDLWPNFVPILNEFARTYRGSLDNASYAKMRDAVNAFMSGQSQEKKQLAQPIPVEHRKEKLLDYYIKLAADLSEEFDNKLKSFNEQAFSVPKKKERAKEKADLPKAKGGYGGDHSCVLDYLRGTVFIDVNKSTSSAKLKERYEKVIDNLQQEIGPAQIVKIEYEKGDQEDEDILKIVVTNNKGTRKEMISHLKFKIVYIEDENGHYLTVPGDMNKYQFQLNPFKQ